MPESIRSSLPPIYKHLFNAFFDRPKVVETRATCDRCAMCDHGDSSPVAMEFFNPETKCCTFWPCLPNYLVGAILADESAEMAEGKRRINDAIATRIGVYPSSLNRPRKMSLLMLGYEEVFGRTKTLKCPYYDDDNPAGSCSIWRHREVICMTYYCKYSGGQRGFEYWTALKSYLAHVQQALAHSAMRAVDPAVADPKFRKNMLTLEDFEDRAPKPSAYQAWWGSWVGREEEFYLACHRWVQSLSPKEFAKSVDQSKQGAELLANLIAKYDVLENKILPKNLVRNARMKEVHVGDKVVVTSYHPYDSFSLDKDLFEVCAMFKADQTLEENLERLKREEGIELVPELVEYLFAAGVLVEPPRPKVAQGEADKAGELNGRRAALNAILEARGIATETSAKAKIDTADAAKLDLWIKKAAVAKSIDDVIDR